MVGSIVVFVIATLALFALGGYKKGKSVFSKD